MLYTNTNIIKNTIYVAISKILINPQPSIPIQNILVKSDDESIPKSVEIIVFHFVNLKFITNG